jgi:twinkle protein
MSAVLIKGTVKALPKRGITEETCAKFKYSCGTTLDGSPVQLAPYFKEGQMVAQKVRTPDKEFSTVGDFKSVELFGQNLWRDGGKMVVVTEGEIDAMTVSQLQSNKWPVVSLTNGSAAGKKAISRNLAWLEKFETVILMFDMDEPGALAIAECAPLFSPGKCKVASLPLKDANEMLMAGRGSEVIDAIWGAKEYRPDGLVSVDEIMDEIKKPVLLGFPWWMDELTKVTYGRRLGELYGFGAGTGVGKTDWLTEQIAFDITQLDMPVGLIFLETPIAELGKRIAGKIKDRQFHIPDSGWTDDELDQGVEALRGKVTLYDNFGQTDWDVVRGHIRYMAAQGIKLFYLDHLTAMADTDNERGSIEQIMKEMAGLAKELMVIIHFVSHLATPEGKPHEEGGRVMVRHFKGARAIGFWAHFLFGLERNQQDDNEELRQVTTFRCLKDRYTGKATGQTFYSRYISDTGRLTVIPNPYTDCPFPKTGADNPDF